MLPQQMTSDEWDMLNAYVRMFYKFAKPGHP
jgi:hypothetical protein